MSPRNTAIAAALLLAIGAWAYFVELRGAEKKKSQEEAERKVFGVTAEDVTSFTVEKGGAAVTCTKVTGAEGTAPKWRVTAPVETEADAFAPADVVRALAELERKSTVEKEASDEALERFGLATPEIKVSFRATDSRSGELWLGRKSPIAETQYGRLAGAREVFLLESFATHSLAKDLFQLRDKKILEIEDAEVTEIELDCQGIQSKVRKQDGRFRVVSPFDDLAGEELMRTLIGNLRFLEALRFEEPGGKPMKDYGLDVPFARLTVRQGTAFAPQTLLVGDKVKSEEAAYVKLAEATSVAIVPATILTDVQKSGKDLREKHAFPFDRYGLAALQIVHGGSGVRFEKAAAAGGQGDWQVRPIEGGQPGEAKPADWRKVDEHVRLVGDVTVKEFLEQAPSGVAFDEGATTVTVELTEDRPTRTFLLSGPPEGMRLFVKDPSRPVILEVPPDAREKLLKKAEDFAPAPAAEAAPAPAEG